MKEPKRKSTQTSIEETTIRGDEEPLPPKIRVHALAKLLGITSKDLIKHLGEEGVSSCSAQSNIDRTQAESVRESLAPKKPIHNYDSLFAAPVITPPHSYESNNSNNLARGNDDAPHFIEAPPARSGRLLRNRKKSSKAGKAAASQEIPVTSHDNSASSVSATEAPVRKNRRGKRGKNRGRKRNELNDPSIQAPDNLAPYDTTNAKLQESSDDSNNASDATCDSGSPTHRRTRKRTRQTPSLSDPGISTLGDNVSDIISETIADDGTTVTIHERPVRRKRTRIPADPVSSHAHASSRITSKHQRRRETQSIYRFQSTVSEEEYRARRDTLKRVMVVREKMSAKGEAYVQVGVLEDDVLVEHFVTTSASSSLVGNIYFGEVQNVLPSMEAAFVNIGLGRNGVLYAGEVDWDSSGLDKKNHKIEEALSPGDKILVQVTKDPVGQKGARLTTQVSLAGRYLVFVPGSKSTGISRRLPESERRRLKTLLSEILPEECGVIVRTAAESVTSEDFSADLSRLQALWATISAQCEELRNKPDTTIATLYEEPDFLVKVVRDLFNEDFTELVIEGDNAWKTVENYITSVAPDLMSRVKRYVPDPDNPEDFFTKYKVQEQLEKALDRKVWLPSGGTLIIERTEAMTVIDVNTGKFVGEGGNLEQTVTQNNLEAAVEIVNQLRLRDIGGMIIIDFIDMILETNQELVLAKLQEELSYDRTRHQISEVTSLGLVQLTRKRIGTGLLEAFSTPCEQCHGLGHIVHKDPIEEANNVDEIETSRNTRRYERKESHNNAKRTTDDPKTEDIKVLTPSGPAKNDHPIFKTLNKKSSGFDNDDEEHDKKSTGSTKDLAESPDDSFSSLADPDASTEDTSDSIGQGHDSVNKNTAATRRAKNGQAGRNSQRAKNEKNFSRTKNSGNKKGYPKNSAPAVSQDNNHHIDEDNPSDTIVAGTDSTCTYAPENATVTPEPIDTHTTDDAGISSQIDAPTATQLSATENHGRNPHLTTPVNNSVQCSIKVAQRSRNRNRVRDPKGTSSSPVSDSAASLSYPQSDASVPISHTASNNDSSAPSDVLTNPQSADINHHVPALDTHAEGTIVSTKTRRRSTLRPSGPPQ